MGEKEREEMGEKGGLGMGEEEKLKGKILKQTLKVIGGYWRLLVVIGGYWRLLVVIESYWWLLVVIGGY